MIYKKGDIIILKGKKSNTGRVITYYPKIKRYLIDRGNYNKGIILKNVWDCNIKGLYNDKTV